MAEKSTVKQTETVNTEDLLKRLDALRAELDEVKAKKEAETPVKADAEAAARENARMNEYVDVELFRDGGDYADDVFVAVNGEGCLIKRGVPVRIRRKFAEVLRMQADMDKRTAALIKSMSE